MNGRKAGSSKRLGLFAVSPKSDGGFEVDSRKYFCSKALASQPSARQLKLLRENDVTVISGGNAN